MIARLAVAAFCFFLLPGCATGPHSRAQEFERSLRQGRTGQAASMMETADGSAVDAAVLTEALQKGRVGDMPLAAEWDRARATAEVEVGRHRYLLMRIGGDWKIRCTTIGPYHDRTPEMTLLLAVHFIRNGDFEAFRRLAPPSLKQSTGVFPEEFRRRLRNWTDEVAAAACHPFALRDGRATLHYGPGGSKTLTMIQSDGRWRILDLW